MAAAYALISILSASGGIIVLWPSLGWWSLASIWPVGALSCLVAAGAVAILRSRDESRDIDHLTDEMVADLRGALAASRQLPGDDEPATSDAQQRYGTAG